MDTKELLKKVRKIEIKTRLEADLQLVKADPNQLEMAILNLSLEQELKQTRRALLAQHVRERLAGVVQ